MENLILAWYVLVATDSVLMLTIFASLNFLGTLFAPGFGVLGDRIGHRRLLWSTRAVYSVLSGSIMTFALLGVISPTIVLAVAALMGLIRPSDIGTRNAVIGETLPPAQMMGAMGLQRSTQDIARISGALTGAGLAVTLGMGPAYAVVTTLYLVSVGLTILAGRVVKEEYANANFGATPAASSGAPPTAATSPSAAGRESSPPKKKRASPWADLREGMAYVWRTPHLRAIMLLAFLLNATAFPIYVSLMPYLVKGVYQETQTVLGYMTACGSTGALLGSILLSKFNTYFRPGRLMLMTGLGWCISLLVLAQTTGPHQGVFVMFFAGAFQSSCLVAMAALLLRHADPQYRGRVMGCRILAIYGNLPGLLLFSPILGVLQYSMTASLYALTGITLSLVIGYRWREHLWHSTALTNTR